MASATRPMSRRPAEGTDTPTIQPCSFDGFLRAVASKDVRTIEKVYQSGYVTGQGAVVSKSAMGEVSGSVGGYLVPEDYSTRLLETIAEESFILPRANVVPMDSREMSMPAFDIETVYSAGTTPLFGGMLFTWGSGQPSPNTSPKFQQMVLTAWDLLGYVNIQNQWLEDVRKKPTNTTLGLGPNSHPSSATLVSVQSISPPQKIDYKITLSGEEYLMRAFGKAAAWYAEYAFLRGTGTAKQMPLGIIAAPGTKSITRAGSSAIALADVANMSAGLLPASWTRAIWACSPSALAKVMQITGYAPNTFSLGAGGLVGFLMSCPVFVTDKLPALGSTGDIILFDPYLYVVGLRTEVLIDSSSLGAGFPTNSTDFRIWLRMDGKPQNSGLITIADAATTVSPFVVLGPAA